MEYCKNNFVTTLHHLNAIGQSPHKFTTRCRRQTYHAWWDKAASPLRHDLVPKYFVFNYLHQCRRRTMTWYEVICAIIWANLARVVLYLYIHCNTPLYASKFLEFLVWWHLWNIGTCRDTTMLVRSHSSMFWSTIWIFQGQKKIK